MAKKSTAARQAHAARRSQTPARGAEVALVRAPKTSSETDAQTPKTRVAVPAERTRAPEVAKASKPAQRAESTAASRQQSARAQAVRVARARAAQRVRVANMITPEHYSYVLGDLKLIGSLAAAMFAVIIILHFALPS